MLAHGDPPQHRTFRRHAHLHQRKIGGPAADIHHQHQPDAFQRRRQIVPVARGEIVKRACGSSTSVNFSKPAWRAAVTVSARATSSKEAGTVMTTSCAASGASGCAWSQARARCASRRVEASTGETLRTSGGAPHGRIGAERSTPGWHSQLLAEATSRPGTRAPCQRANSPTMLSGASPHGKRSVSAGSSCSPAK